MTRVEGGNLQNEGRVRGDQAGETTGAVAVVTV